MKGPNKSNKKGASKNGSAPSTAPIAIMSPPSQQSDVSSTKTAELKTKLARASDLETRLANLSISNTSSEEKAQRTRMALCETLSDVLLIDPTFAMRKDCTGRLWRGCFYGRIGELRGRIAREKNRLKRAASGKDGDGMEGEITSTISDLEKSLKVFLDEAVVLYEYLVDKYEGMLFPAGGSQPSQGSTGSKGNGKKGNHGKTALSAPLPATSDADETVASAAPISSGVVPNLHRLLIHLGDLHRYASSFPKSETSYSAASKLAPGKGNPYNQLAVVAQLKDVSGSPMTCVSLYWYARSLLAAHDPFETSRANLSRLFGTNRAWLDANPKDNVLPYEMGGGKKAALEHVRAVKSASSRRFLARFVDVHGDFFRGVAPTTCLTSNGKAQSLVRADAMADKLTGLADSLVSLLAGAAFGDALLVKMAAVNAFSVCSGGNEGSPTSPPDKEGIVKCSRTLARGFALLFASALAERVEGTLRKLGETAVAKREKARAIETGSGKRPQQRGSTPTVRLLAPLVLLCDFFLTLDRTELKLEGEEKTKEFQEGSEKSYWSNIVALANAIEAVDDVLFLKEQKGKHQQATETVALMKEYEDLRGYAPFQSFVNPHGSSGGDSDEDGRSFASVASPVKKKKRAKKDVNKGENNVEAYVSAEEAIRVLELASASSSQASQGSASSGKGGDAKSSSTKALELETRAKVSRFLAYLDRTISREEEGHETVGPAGWHLARDVSSGTYSYGLGEQAGGDDDDAAAMVVEEEEKKANSAGRELMQVDDKPSADSVLSTSQVDIPKSSQPKYPGQYKPTATDNDAKEQKQEEEGISDDDEEDDVVVYKPSESGSGQALLVPGNLLLAKTPERKVATPAVSRVAKGSSGGGVSLSDMLGVAPQAQESPPPAAVAPPPPAPAMILPLPQAQPQVKPHPQVAQKQLSPPPGLTPPPGLGFPSPAHGPSVLAAPQTMHAASPGRDLSPQDDPVSAKGSMDVAPAQPPGLGGMTSVLPPPLAAPSSSLAPLPPPGFPAGRSNVQPMMGNMASASNLTPTSAVGGSSLVSSSILPPHPPPPGAPQGIFASNINTANPFALSHTPLPGAPHSAISSGIEPGQCFKQQESLETMPSYALGGAAHELPLGSGLLRETAPSGGNREAEANEDILMHIVGGGNMTNNATYSSLGVGHPHSGTAGEDLLLGMPQLPADWNSNHADGRVPMQQPSKMGAQSSSFLASLRMDSSQQHQGGQGDQQRAHQPPVGSTRNPFFM